MSLATWTEEELRGALVLIADLRKMGQFAWNEALHPRDAHGQFAVAGTHIGRAMIEGLVHAMHDGMTQRSRATHSKIYHMLHANPETNAHAAAYWKAYKNAANAKQLIHPKEAYGKAIMSIHTGDPSHLEAGPAKVQAVGKPGVPAKPKMITVKEFHIAEGAREREAQRSVEHIQSLKVGISAIKSYTGSWFSGLNKNLRNGVLEVGDRKKTEQLDAALRPFSVQENLIISRSYGGSAEDKIRKAGVGGIFMDPGYGSTHLQPQYNEVVIEVPKGSPGLHVKTISHYPGENEFLLPRDSEFDILAIGEGSGSIRLRLRGSHRTAAGISDERIEASLTVKQVEQAPPLTQANANLYANEIAAAAAKVPAAQSLYKPGYYDTVATEWSKTFPASSFDQWLKAWTSGDASVLGLSGPIKPDSPGGSWFIKHGIPANNPADYDFLKNPPQPKDTQVNNFGVFIGTGAKKIDGPHGSQPGQWWQTALGTKIYAKPMSKERATNEVGAAEAYKTLAPPSAVVSHNSAAMPNTWVAQDGNQQYYVVSQEVQGITPFTGPEWQMGAKSDTGAASDAKKLWAYDVLLSHWDVAGLGHDNLVVGQKGQAVRIDTGGAMKYRAQGAVKETWKVGGKWDEAWTLRGMGKDVGGHANEQAKAIFGHMTNKEAADALSQMVIHIKSENRLEYLKQRWTLIGMSQADITANLAVIQDRLNRVPVVIQQLMAQPEKTAFPQSAAA